MRAPPSFPTRIRVDLPNWLGDQMMAMPAVQRLVEANRGGATTLHTRPSMSRFLAGLFPATEVVASPRKASPLASARVVCGGSGRFEIGVTLRNSARAKILVSLGARWTVGSIGEGARVLLSAPRVIDRTRHQVFDAEPILDTLALPRVDLGWRPRLPIEMAAVGEAVLARVDLQGGPVIGLAPTTARGEAKRWPAKYFGELARRLIDRGLHPLVVVGPGEEATAVDLASAAGQNLPVAGPALDVAGLAGLIARLGVLVGNDSGPMHVATCFGTPVVAIFGPSDPRRTAPLGERDVILERAVPCAPCTGPGCLPGHHECMRNITVDEVEAAVLASLRSSG
jgi:heptosyltransferase-2